MSDRILILLVLIGVALLIAAQGYGFLIQGQVLLEPEEKAKIGARLVYTGLALVLVGTLVTLSAVLLLIFNPS